MKKAVSVKRQRLSHGAAPAPLFSPCDSGTSSMAGGQRGAPSCTSHPMSLLRLPDPHQRRPPLSRQPERAAPSICLRRGKRPSHSTCLRLTRSVGGGKMSGRVTDDPLYWTVDSALNRHRLSTTLLSPGFQPFFSLFRQDHSNKKGRRGTGE